MDRPTEWPWVRAVGKQSYLFASLLIFMLMGPVIGPASTPVARSMMYVVMIFAFITGPLAASKTRGNLVFTSLLGVSILLTGVSSSIFPQVVTFNIGLGVVFFGYLAGLVGRDLLKVTTEVSTETLWMAVNVYLLTGLFFAFLYAGVVTFDDDAFTGKFMDAPLVNQIYGFVYFSFVTLTTLGYGDITPANIVVGTLTYLEALFGQLFIAIMIARLVGLYTARE